MTVTKNVNIFPVGMKCACAAVPGINLVFFFYERILGLTVAMCSSQLSKFQILL